MTNLPANVTMSVSSLLVSNGDIEGLRHGTETPGGFASCSFGICGAGRKGIDWGDVVVIHDNQYDKYPFIGRVSNLHKTGLTYEITATRSSKDRTYTINTVPADANHPGGFTSQRIYQAGTLLATILSDALTITPDIFDGGIVNPGLQLVSDSNDLGGYTAEQIWDYVSSIIGSLATPLLWHIRGINGVQAVVIDFQDIAPRYFTHLAEDQIEENYDMTAIVTEVGIAFGNGQIATESIPAGGVIPIIRTKYISAQNTVTRHAEADAIAGALLTRLGQRRSVNDVLTVDCNKDQVRAVSPVTSPLVAVDGWPLYLIESGRGIELLDRDITETSFNLTTKYITGTDYDWDSGKLTLRCGEIRSIQSDTLKIVDYNVNRLFTGPYNGPPGGNHPLADADLLPKVGPEIDAQVPPSTSYGVPAFKAALGDNDPDLPHKKAIDPDIIADEGLEANFNFDPATIGFQGGIRVVPGTFNEYEIILGNAAGKVADTCTVQVYKDAEPAPTFLFLIEITGQKSRTAAISPAIVLGRKDFMLLKVLTPTSTATWAAVSLHAKKNYPGLKT